LLAGDAARIGNYTTQSISFPAGSSTSITVPVTISGNTVCERNEDLVFELQNVSGGCNAIPTGIPISVIRLDDDKSGTEIEMTDDFEDGDASGWTDLANWDVINSAGTISGSYDLKHVNGGVAANDAVTFDLCNTELRGAETTWRANIKHGGFNTSSNNWVMWVISANQQQIWDGLNTTSATLDGYAVGVNFNTATDNLRFVRIDNGVYTDLITSTYNWSDINIPLGIEVIRDADGLWEFKYRENGGFVGMTSVGTITDNSYVVAKFMAYAIEVTAGNAGKPRIDDVSVEQYGCFEDWYTTGTGNASAAIWSQNPADVVGSNLTFGRFKNLTVQNGHTLTQDVDVLSHDFTIESGAVVDAAGLTLAINRNLTNDGTYTANGGTVRFDMYNGATIGGSSVTQFQNVEMEGKGTLQLSALSAEMRGVFYPNKGQFDVGGNLVKLLSDGSGTASIAEFKSGTSWTGQLNLQRHIPAGDQIWFNLGNPLTGVTFDDWNDDVTTTGFNGADWPFWGFNNIVSYDETISGDLDQGFIGTADVSDPISHETGYMIYLEGAAQDIEVRGDLQIGDIAQSLSYTTNSALPDDGWNLVVNRYPSEIDWNLLYANSTGVGSTYFVHDGDGFSGTRNYVLYDAA
ncbi:MAG: hypothetical protein HKN32_03465, partial [Flavobacteriales bacterium]|nr:hypothetical protein [Flavobacteriales bacterium]